MKCGAEVCVLDYNEKATNAFKAEEPSIGVIITDLLDVESTLAKVKGNMAEFGPFSYLVNCAGLAAFQPFFETEPKKFDL
jgi:NAD(P)-dependent dehydrogenase (short-subunit alcohol dehydrogenase family)